MISLKDFFKQLKREWFLTSAIVFFVVLATCAYNKYAGPFPLDALTKKVVVGKLPLTYNHKSIGYIILSALNFGFILAIAVQYLKIRNYLREEINNIEFKYSSSAEKLFLCGLSLLTLGLALPNTDFQTGKVGAVLTYIAYFLFLYKIYNFDVYSRNNFDLIIVLLVICGLVKLISGYSEPMILAITIISAKGIDFDKIVKTHMVVIGIVIVLCFIASLIGFIPNISYPAGARGIRYSFGIRYPTTFGAYVFFEYLAFIYVMKRRLWWLNAIIGIGSMWFVLTYTDARAAFFEFAICLCGYLTIVGLEHIDGSVKTVLDRIMQEIAQIAMPFCCITIIYLSAMFDPRNPFYKTLDKLLSTRLTLGHQGLATYGITLLGQYVPSIAMSTFYNTKKAMYFYLDSSYLRIFLRYGIVFLLLVFVLNYFSCKKRKSDSYYFLCIILIAINGIVEQRLIDIIYNPFILALFACKARNEV